MMPADQLDRLVASSLMNVLRVERVPQFPSVVTFMMLLNVASSTVSPARLGHNIAEATDPFCWWRCVHPSRVAPACNTEPGRVAMRRPAPAPVVDEAIATTAKRALAPPLIGFILRWLIPLI